MFYIQFIKIFNNGDAFMDIRSLNTFIQVTELGSFSRAAEKLGYSQPTVSVQIRQLEETLDVKLFDRIGHSVRLTDKGREILRYAQNICHMCQQMEHAAGQSSAVRGTIRLATAESLCAPLIRRGFSQLREMYPEISMELTTAGTGDLFRLLDQNQVDIVCTLDSHIYNPNYVIACEEKLGVHFVVSAEDPLARTEVLSVENLQRQDFLLTEKNMSYRRLLDEWLERRSVVLQPVLENGNAALLCDLVQQGVGMSFLPDYVTEQAVRQGKLVRLNAEGFVPELWKQLLYRRDKWVSPPMQAVLGHMKGILLEEPDL